MPHLDVFGHRGSSDAARQQFLIADLHRSIHVHQTTLELDSDTEVFGRSMGQLILVADGLQTNGSGGRAGRLALESVSEYLLNAFLITDRSSREDQQLQSELTEAIRHCEQRLRRATQATGVDQALTVELTAVFVLWPEAFVVQVGRVCCDHWRDSNLFRLTNDAHAETLGVPSGSVTPALARVTLRSGDKLLVSTQGLHAALPVHEIAQMLARPNNAEQICRHLVDAASAASDSSHAAVVVCVNEDAPQMPSQTAAESAVSEPTAAVPVQTTRSETTSEPLPGKAADSK